MGWYPHPEEIEYLSQQNILRMRFSDGHEVDYPAMYLRGFCPCAHCQGHRAGPPEWQAIVDHSQIEVVDLTPVGNYAFCITWGDGHDTGIYSFQWLRVMCPCHSCKPEGVAVEHREFGAGKG